MVGRDRYADLKGSGGIMEAGMTCGTDSHQQHGEAIPGGAGGPGLGFSGRVEFRGRGFLGMGILNALSCIQENTHRGLQVRHYVTHRTQVIAKAWLTESGGSMLCVCPQSEVTLWCPSLGTSSPHQLRFTCSTLLLARGVFSEVLHLCCNLSWLKVSASSAPAGWTGTESTEDTPRL